MNEQEIRAIVREAVARRIRTGVGAACRPAASPPPADPWRHTSHGLLPMAPPVTEGEPCVIEPHVACGLCGFCQSLGH